VYAVVGVEEQGAVHVHELGDVAQEARIEVGHQGGAIGGAVGLPELPAMGPVVGGEEEPAVRDGEMAGVGAAGSGADVSHKHGAGGGAVAAPELEAVNAVLRHEEEHAAQGLHLLARVGLIEEPSPVGGVQICYSGGGLGTRRRGAKTGEQKQGEAFPMYFHKRDLKGVGD
jgi:hypothetical protein